MASSTSVKQIYAFPYMTVPDASSSSTVPLSRFAVEVSRLTINSYTGIQNQKLLAPATLPQPVPGVSLRNKEIPYSHTNEQPAFTVGTGRSGQDVIIVSRAQQHDLQSSEWLGSFICLYQPSNNVVMYTHIDALHAVAFQLLSFLTHMETVLRLLDRKTSQWPGNSLPSKSRKSVRYPPSYQIQRTKSSLPILGNESLPSTDVGSLRIMAAKVHT